MINRFLTGFLLVSLASGTAVAQSEGPQNVILVIADGTGPATYTLAREYRTATGGPDLVFDQILTGAVRTSSADSRVTDSASSATAMASGQKTDNGVIGMDTDNNELVTVLEEAIARGMATGMVSTARITHATPASFGAHVVSRDLEAEIANQLLATRPDLLLGGGSNFFLPVSQGGDRADGTDLVEIAQEAGYHVARDESSLLQLGLPLLGLFASSHMAYEIDRKDSGEPSLATMTRRALELLSESPEGFFLLVEAGRVDHAGHENDIGAHLQDFLAYDDAMGVVMDFARSDGNTLVVATSDHETGGLSLARDGVYEWYPERIGQISSSIEPLVWEADALLKSTPSDPLNALSDLLASKGIDVNRGDASELERLASPSIMFIRDLKWWIEDATARQGGIAWTTHGHTGIDVPLHSFGPGSEAFSGLMQNDHLGRLLLDVVRATGTADH